MNVTLLHNEIIWILIVQALKGIISINAILTYYEYFTNIQTYIQF